MLIDKFNRVHDYLRISLTDRCNLRCTYCNPVDFPKGHFAGATRMTVEEIDQLVAVFVNEGVRKIRLTGGEPLMRKDIQQIIERISAYPVELAISTNGVLVHKYLDVFKNAGIRSVNVSLDSLTSEKFFAITKRNEFDRILENIHLLLDNDFHVKINVVVIRDLNHDELTDFVAWTKHHPLHVRFIEFMPFADNEWSRDKIFSYTEMLDVITSKYECVKLDDGKHDTDKKFRVPGHEGTFAVISSMTQPFCGGCNRMRLTTDGKMKNCLFSKGEVDLLGALRQGVDVLPLIKQCMWMKEEKLGGQVAIDDAQFDPSTIENRSMLHIGG